MDEYVKRKDVLHAITQHNYFETADIVEAVDAVSTVDNADVVPWDWLKQFAEGKRFNYASDFVAEAKKEYERED